MASVSSLDKDLRNSRLGKYTPQAANEARGWIEEALGEQIANGDLLGALKDGVALCRYGIRFEMLISVLMHTFRLVNLVSDRPGIRYKQSSMPFVQMENISHFLRACQSPPINLQPHDVFQTVDLYEAKDPAQVLQCIGAFSRKAHALQPVKFASAIGGKGKAAVLTPQSTGGYSASSGKYPRARDVSNTSDSNSTTSSLPSWGTRGKMSPTRSSGSNSSTPVNGTFPNSSSGGVSSWSKKTDEVATTPAWNIHQYGYMGGASQGNQGITFGGRRQITTPAPKIPSLAEKERKRREDEAEFQRLQVLAEEAEHKRRVEREAEEERDRIDEEQRWLEEARQQKERGKKAAEEEKRKWEEEERKWKEEEEARIREEKEAELRIEKERQRKRVASDTRLKGQFLSQYQAEQRQLPPTPSDEDPQRTAERNRVKELELELEKAKERERQYERERQERLRSTHTQQHHDLETHDIALHLKEKYLQNDSPSKARPLPTAPSHSHQNSDESWRADEREYLRHEWANHHTDPTPSEPSPPPQPARPLPIPQASTPTPPHRTHSPPLPSLPARPLPDPKTYTPPFSSKPTSNPITHSPSKPASSSLLSREMELDRLRQQEWEEAQKATKAAAASAVGGSANADMAGTRPGEGAWDVNQYGYLGGDSQNRVGPGLGGGRRQIIGPRVEVKKGGA